MENFAHIKTVIGIILGLSITHSLKGAIKIIEHPTKIKPYWVQLLWGFYMFLSTVYFWWFEIHLSEVTDWTFFKYLFIITYTIIYYILAVMLFPEDTSDYKDYKNYFFYRKRWFFAFLAALFVFDFFDTYIKGANYMARIEVPYLVRGVLHISLCLVAMKSNKKTVQAAVVIIFLIYQIAWICTYYLNG
ncbi:hypothetical protein ABIB40_002247 [Pedobacter sp. UYP30]|uniref:hypothetical protein n=1 Tax=Pedobacter sp. UYP30 TaxID=1756400 RepID=UPI003396C576